MKNNIKYILVVLSIAVTTFLTSCGEDHAEGDGHGHEEEGGHGGGGEHHEEGGIHLSSKQIKTISLEFGDFSKLKVNDFVKTTGVLGLPPDAFAAVSAKGEGIVSGNKKFIEGNPVKKGEIIAYIENPDFIVKQQEYLESKAQLNYKKLELERQKKLVDANAGVSKTLENAEAEYAILEAKTKGLEQQLLYLGISTKKLSPNTIQQRIPIRAPISGFITKINLHNGMYAQPTIPLMEIISDEHIHLELDVFENDVANIKIGQKISYTVPALGNTLYNGEVSVIGKEFKGNSKTIRVHGHLVGEKPLFIKDLFINAKIWLNDKTTTALPEAAIVNDGGSSFIYVAKDKKGAKEISFKKIMVIPGATNNGYTSVKLLDKIPKGNKIVVKGAYYVYAQSKAGALKHEH